MYIYVVFMYVYVAIRVYIHTESAYVCAYLPTYIYMVNTCKFAYRHTEVRVSVKKGLPYGKRDLLYAQKRPTDLQTCTIHSCKHECIDSRTHIHIHTCTHIRAHTHMHTHTHTHTCTLTHTHTRIHTYGLDWRVRISRKKKPPLL